MSEVFPKNLDNAYEHRLDEYSKKFIGVTNPEKIKEILKRVFLDEQLALAKEKERRFKMSDIAEMLKSSDYSVTSILSGTDQRDTQEEIFNFININKNLFKTGTNIFMFESGSGQPSFAVVYIDNIDELTTDLDKFDDTGDIKFYRNQNVELLDALNLPKANLIKIDQFKE